MAKVTLKTKNGGGQPRTGTRKQNKKLELWQRRLADADAGFSPEVLKMDDREQLYNGDKKTLDPLVDGDKPNERATHRRNIIFENIESKVSTQIPQPQVRARRQKDEPLARIIENWLRSELDRQKFEVMNDMGERVVPMHGGAPWLVEWDSNTRSIDTVGAQRVSLMHPKQLAPQPGVYTGVEDMDWVILKIPTTKGSIRRRYGVDVSAETEAEPELRGVDRAELTEDMVTQYMGFAMNDEGGIDLFSWAGNTQIEDLENYQARRQPVCGKCGRVRPLRGQIISSEVVVSHDDGFAMAREAEAGHRMAEAVAMQQPDSGFLAGVGIADRRPEHTEYGGGACPWCGSDSWEEREMEYEEVFLPIQTALGTRIPGMHEGFDEDGNPAIVPTMIPYYKPNIYPVVIQKSVYIFGRLLGNSDVDVITDQQNTINRLEKKIIDRLLKAGTRVTLPEKLNLKLSPTDGEKWFLKDMAQKQMIDVYEFSGNLQWELNYLAIVYEESRQILGITDSFQGRKDPTATSGRAKEFAASQSAGRMESQRAMKNAAYAQLFEVMFKFQLAYADEPWPVMYTNHMGETVYEEFNRYDFLEQDETGQWRYNDAFNFSVATSAPLENNREAMWQECRMNLESGAFGDPKDIRTLILFWGKMEKLHYPGAGETKKYLEERLKREQQAAMAQSSMQQGIPNMAPAVPLGQMQ